MKHLRTLALVLAMAMCLTACGNGAASSGAANSAASSAEDTNANLPAEALTDVVSYLTDGAYTADSVIATVGDIDVTAAEALYWAAYQRYSMTYYYYTNYGYSINMTDDMGDGTTVGEYLLNAGISTALAYATGAQKANETGVTLSDENAAAVEGLGTTNIETYGQDRFPGMDICAKSGTAEVGADKTPNAWFTGFLRDEATPYAFIVLVENGGGGSSVAGTVASQVLQAAVEKGY